ncbi:hypothetical protein BTH42_15835 [Burkholderia sp. SRS-W-2-2016]|uniref:hypothetical protein n=1 Tax=Burkholderia sp. SRS-W-2-2016 TaxID=1926878 RepID=UPI00094B745C|nr:hypothetical protein [Burkholderia sp. SRS-W-2-2016]OLL30628.1 hypothetical protein BTH42_15835 [Burkholderia sp. SRS-W-2-2016]
MIDSFPVASLDHDLADAGMLLFALAATPVVPAVERGWFRRRAHACATVISREEDVSDVLLRLPQSWNIVDGARCKGLHDDEDIVASDPRFDHGCDPRSFAIVAHAGGERFAMLMMVNAAEAVLMPERLFRKEQSFERCVFERE